MRERNGLISTAELAGVLGQPDLRLFDCTTYLEYQPAGSGIPYIAVPGRHTFEAGHIPGADFLDLQGEFSDQSTELRFMMAATAQCEAAFGRHGVGNGGRVVLYSIGTMMWATRFWWMLQSLGFDALVLDGGFDKWQAEGRANRDRAAKGYPPATFPTKPRPGYFRRQRETLKASTEANSVVVNALGPQFHKGLEPSRYGRADGFPAASMFPRQRWSMRKPRRSCRSQTPRQNSPAPGSPRTSASSPIAAVAFRRRSTCSSFTGSVTATSPSMTARWRMGQRRVVADRDGVAATSALSPSS